jgi:hypothetical protein
MTRRVQAGWRCPEVDGQGGKKIYLNIYIDSEPSPRISHLCPSNPPYSLFLSSFAVSSSSLSAMTTSTWTRRSDVCETSVGTTWWFDASRRGRREGRREGRKGKWEHESGGGGGERTRWEEAGWVRRTRDECSRSWDERVSTPKFEITHTRQMTPVPRR